jgi:branched-chain amino acid transport system ATP-binding protein
VHLALSGADRGYVMETGRIVHHGAAKALIDDPAVRKAYLGL